MIKRVFFCSLLIGIVSTLSAADPSSEAISKSLAPFLDDQVVLVARLDATKLNVEGVLSLDGEVNNRSQRALARIRPVAIDLRKRFIAAGGTELYWIYSITAEQSASISIVAPLSPSSKQPELTKIMEGLFIRGSSLGVARVGDALVVGSQDVGAKFADNKFKATPRPEFSAGFVAMGNTSLQAVFSLSRDQRRVIAELSPALPAELANTTAAQLVKGIDWFAAGIDYADQPRGLLVAQVTSAPETSVVQDFLSKLMAYSAVQTSLPNSVQVALKSGKLVPQISGNQVSMTLSAENQGVMTLKTLITDSASEVWTNLSDAHVRDHLKELALAMHNYHDNYARFPPSVPDPKEGKSKLSWRVQLLPWLDAGRLHQKFKHDEPWDSKHNIALLKEMPEIFATLDQDPAAGMTTYQMPANKGMLGSSPTGYTIRDITDGTSNTIMLLQVDPARAVPWTKPEDFEIDLKDPWKGLVTPGEDGFRVGFADGSVRYFTKKGVGEELLKYLTINGGEVIK